MTAACPPTVLSDDERALVDLLAEGLSAAAIGRRLFIGERTAQKRVQALTAKTGTRNAAQLVALVLRPTVEPEPAEPDTRSFTERIADAWGDTTDEVAARRRAMVADLETYQERRGTPYRPSGRPRCRVVARDDDREWSPSGVLAGAR